MVAYYAADAGLERSLYLLRKKEVGIDDLKNLSGSTFSAGSTWTLASSTSYEPTFFRQRLQNGQSVKLFFSDRETSKAKSLQLSWSTPNLSNARLQVSFTQLTPSENNGVYVYYNDINNILLSDTSHDGPICYNFKNSDSQNVPWQKKVDYLVEIKVIGSGNGDEVDNLIVKAYNKDCHASDYEASYNYSAISNLTLRSVGSYGGSSQAIVAQVMPRDPLAGLLGFVLFSENEIFKGY